ncbi:mosquitocidal toxin [Fusarium circinatum]|uniref:Mosquitocidal toxin n=1 Tax=Fusarium circinatum TaxID=48490 RepID=A0A8H5U7W1_FUSCI|nr:mosquitocidal toxin [Fusarium circinatum]
MHIPSLLLSTIQLLSIASAFPSRISNPERLYPRVLLNKLKASAGEDSLRYQPALDFDKDGCYNTAAIDRNGTVNKGLSTWGNTKVDCRHISRLDNANVYTRKRCNNGWCAYMQVPTSYARKFRLTGSSRRHSWEVVVVFVKYNIIRRVAISAHDGYHPHDGFDHRDKPLTQDGHPLIVYHKKTLGAHALRFANDEDVKKPENHYGKWVMSDLVGWDGFPTPEYKQNLSTYKFARDEHFHLSDALFGQSLQKAAGKQVDGFDCFRDGGEEYKKKDKKQKDMRKEERNKQKKKVKGKSKSKVEKKDSKTKKGEHTEEEDDSGTENCAKKEEDENR